MDVKAYTSPSGYGHGGSHVPTVFSPREEVPMEAKMSEANRKPVHREFDGNLETNMPQWAQFHVDALFVPDVFPEWTHSGMAYAFAEKMGVNDLEEFVYMLNEEIKRRNK